MIKIIKQTTLNQCGELITTIGIIENGNPKKVIISDDENSSLESLNKYL